MIYTLTGDDIPMLSHWIKKSLFKRTRIFGADIANGLHSRGRIKRKAESNPELGQALPVVGVFITQVNGFGVEALDNKRA